MKAKITIQVKHEGVAIERAFFWDDYKLLSFNEPLEKYISDEIRRLERDVHDKIEEVRTLATESLEESATKSKPDEDDEDEDEPEFATEKTMSMAWESMKHLMEEDKTK